ncbi:MAG: hypothetical protein WCF84_13070 [Anaerolineae bacterium]
MQPIDLKIGGDAEYILFQILDAERPEATDYWDANWLVVDVSLQAGAFRGKYRAAIERYAFLSFREQVQHLYAALDAQAKFETMEGQVLLTLVGDRFGHIALHGVAMDRPGDGNRLTFESRRLDQSWLPGIIKQLDNIVAQYPVKGI